MSKWTALMLSMVLSIQVNSEAVKIIGAIPVVISDETLNTPFLHHNQTQTVFVENIRLSPEAQEVLQDRVRDISEDIAVSEESIQEQQLTKLNLGMNGTPVLDQGVHGSCVTFTMTAAFDAILGEGDAISPLCSLALGTYLKKKKLSRYSGWDGSFGEVVLKQFQNYGLVSMSYQKESGCSGLKNYPGNDKNNMGNPMTINEYTANAIPLSSVATWDSLVDTEQAFTKNHNPTLLLRSVKKHLREGKRVSFGVLVDVNQGHVGAVGTFQKKFDTWVLTPEIINHAMRGKIDASHEMLIIGYDDEALIYDSKNRMSKGIFILRNSWGSRAGDKGNFYMSYAYFKALSNEAQVIIPVN